MKTLSTAGLVSPYSSSASASSTMHRSATDSATHSSSTSGLSSNPSASGSYTQTSTSPNIGVPTSTSFQILANTFTDSQSDGLYAKATAGGSISLAKSSASSAYIFRLDADGHFISGGLWAQITTGTVPQVPFINSISTSCKSQSATPHTCSNPLGSTISQAYSQSHYLGASLECEPLVLASIASSSASESRVASTSSTAD